MLNFTALPSLSLYIHIPWCEQKCPYCDFNSHKAPYPLSEQAYIDALIRDLEQEIPTIWGRTIHSIFIGGGTPSLLSAQAYQQLFSSLRALLAFSPTIEITLEANPGSLSRAYCADLLAIGINRLSIGVQSFHNPSLLALGRIHTSQQAITAIEAAQQAGFSNINLDLMFGIPEQTAASANNDIRTAISLAPSHISYYQLTLEPNTLFHHQPPRLADEDTIIDWQLTGQQQLAAAGYQQYEVSAYAQTNKQCQHNLNYWQFGDYLGIGAGAHSKISDASQQLVRRRCKQKQPQAYLESSGCAAVILSQETVNERELAFEFMLNALRLHHGFASSLFYQHTGLALSQISATLTQAEQQGFITWDHQSICPTDKGRRYLNSLMELFLPSSK